MLLEQVLKLERNPEFERRLELPVKKTELTKESAVDIFIFTQKVKQSQAARINRVRDEELQIELNILDMFVADLLLLKYNVVGIELEQAFFEFDLESMAQVSRLKQKTDDAF